MKTKAYFMLAVGIALLAAGPLQGREPARTLDEVRRIESKVRAVAAKVMPATVALISSSTGSSGSGVLVSADGLILTAAHVVEGNRELIVMFPDSKQVHGKVLGANYSRDIALVRIVENGPWPFAKRGESKPLAAGDWVVALGHSGGFVPDRPPPVRFGRVVSDGPGNFFTTDCALIGGDSGGPLFDLEGRVVGINSNIGESLANNNHAGVDAFAENWDRLLAGDHWGRLSLNPFANPDMPALGVEMGRSRGNGVPVAELDPDSPAAKAGLRAGDLIQTMDGSEVRDGADLLIYLAKKKPGDRVRVGVDRDGVSQALTVTLAARNEELPLTLNPSNAAVPLISETETQRVMSQTGEFNQALESVLGTVGKSTVRVWSGQRRLAYGTVVGDGRTVLTKFSEVARAMYPLMLDAGDGVGRPAIVRGVYRKEDVAVLEVGGEALTPVAWHQEELPPGAFMLASQPGGALAASGVVSVGERNLRDDDKPYLGVGGLPLESGRGLRVDDVGRGTAAAAAGLRPGDVIVRINDREVSDLKELRAAIASLKPASRVRIEVEREGATVQLETVLGRRSEMRLPPNPQLARMNAMGVDPSRVREGFPNAVQSNMALETNAVGGPVADLHGRAVGLTLACAGRTASYIMPAAAVVKMLASPPEKIGRAAPAAPDQRLPWRLRMLPR